MKLTGLLAAACAVLVASCLGPEEPGTAVAVSIHYSFAQSQASGDSDPNGGFGVPGDLATSLDSYAAVVRVRVDVPGSGPQEQDVTLGYGQASAGSVDAEFYVESGDGRSVSVVGYAAGFDLDGNAAVVAFETSSPVPVDMTGPEAAVDVYPDLVDSGTVSGWVKRGGVAATGGSIVLGDRELSIAFPAAPVTRDPASGQSRFSISGVPLNRSLEVYFVDANGTATLVGTRAFAGAQETFNISL